MRKVFEWIDDSGRGIISSWRLEQEQRAKLDAKIDMLRKAEIDPNTRKVMLPPELLVGPNVYGQQMIYKLKIKGRVALRPFLALNQDGDWVFLARAVEKDGKLDPPGKAAAAQAEQRRQQVFADTLKQKLLDEDKQ